MFLAILSQQQPPHIKGMQVAKKRGTTCMESQFTSFFPGDQFLLSFLGEGALEGVREGPCEAGRGSDRAAGKSATASDWLRSGFPCMGLLTSSPGSLTLLVLLCSTCLPQDCTCRHIQICAACGQAAPCLLGTACPYKYPSAAFHLCSCSSSPCSCREAEGRVQLRADLVQGPGRGQHSVLQRSALPDSLLEILRGLRRQT